MKFKYLFLSLIFLCEVCCIQIFSQSVNWEKLNIKLPSYASSFGFNSKGYIYIGTRNWGIFRSKDSGASWERLYEGLSLDRVDCIFETSDKNLLAGVSFGGHLIMGPKPLGIFRSEDDGDTWENVLETIWVWKILKDSKNFLYACTNSFNISTKMVRSDDNGESWERIDDKLPEYDIVDMAISPIDIIIAYKYNGSFFSSYDRGENWNQLDNEFEAGYSSLLYNSKGVLFAYNDSSGLCKSFDSGKSWYKTNLNLPEYSFRSLAIDKKNRLFVVTTKYGLFVSQDNGITWNQIKNGLLNKNITAVGFDNQNFIYLGIIQPERKYEEDYYIVLRGCYK